MPMGRGNAAPPGCPIASLMSRPPAVAEARVESEALGDSAKAHAYSSVLAPTSANDKRQISFELRR
jgi:hypothetical protein